MRKAVDARSKILRGWLALSEFSGMDDHLQFYITSGCLSSPSDLYKLSLRHLFLNPDISEEDAYTIIESTESCKNMGISRVLLALVPDLEPRQIQQMTSKPCSIQELLEQCSSSEFYDRLPDELSKLEQLGIDMSFREDTIFDDLDTTPFTGKIVVLSGTLSAEYPDVKESLESLGAKVDNKITKKTDYLLAGENSGDILDLALKIGVRIITETDVMEMLGIEA